MKKELTPSSESDSKKQQMIETEHAQSLGTLSAGIAHHFNSLLSIILGYTSFVLNREKLSFESAEALRKVTDAAQRGRRLTEEMLAFMGSEEEEETPSPIHDTVRAVLSLLEPQTNARVFVETRLEASRDIVLSLPSSIRHIIYNLLTNAIDSMPSGGRLTISSSNVELATEAGRHDFLRLEVVDTSGALPKDISAKKSASADKLGKKLSSVYGMVGRLEGTVLVSSEPGLLTRVEVFLPTVQEQTEARKEKKVRRRLAPSLIWVVDDDAVFRGMCRQVLVEEGHTLEEFPTGDSLRAHWEKQKPKPDLLIVDFSMPEFNGLELCEWLREKQSSKVPVVLVSGFATSQPDIKKALKMRKVYFLQKPFSSRDLADTVTVAMGETLIG